MALSDAELLAVLDMRKDLDGPFRLNGGWPHALPTGHRQLIVKMIDEMVRLQRRVTELEGETSDEG